jgi:TonB family protein
MEFTAIVEKSGLLSNIHIISTSDKKVAEKVIAALYTSPKWTPERKDGELARAYVREYLYFIPESDEVKEEMPSFNGGNLNTFREWVAQRLVYPRDAQKQNIQGQVTLKFVIERDGSLTNVEVISSPDYLLSNEAVRVVRMSPKWSPGKQKGRPVRVAYVVPINFGLIPNW